MLYDKHAHEMTNPNPYPTGVGIIEGASEDRGLGFEFLRHIERTKVLCYVIDASGSESRDPIDDFKCLLKVFNG